ncbi:MAG: hypothetical protein JRF63_08100, partial [Deltaproteobacteria bacterium]|nr:hypothetical protein [Deltaproteobacteria bacterium]
RELLIDDNPALAGLEGLSGIGGDVEQVLVSRNDSLDSLVGLQEISAADRLDIRGNHALVDLEGLHGFTSVSGDLYVIDNDNLANLDALSGVTGHVGEILVTGNGLLVDVGGLSAVTSVQWLTINSNDVLPDCEVCDLLGQLAEDPNELTVEGNAPDECTPVPDNCDSEICPDYTGDDPCCWTHNPCEWELNDICDCDSTCAWDAVDCEW